MPEKKINKKSSTSTCCIDLKKLSLTWKTNTEESITQIEDNSAKQKIQYKQGHSLADKN